MKRQYNREKTDTVLSLLTDIGSMTSAELMRLTGRGHGSIRDSISRLRADKKIYISRYIAHGKRGRRQPVYSVGNERDAEEGRASSKQRNAKYRAKHRMVIRAKDAVRHNRPVNIWAGLLRA